MALTESPAAPAASSVRAPLESDDIRRLLPHRAPFLFLDRVIELEPGRRGVGVKNVAVSEPHFAGHFPESAVMPGVLIVEALAQLAGVVIGTAPPEGASGRTYLASVSRMRFRVPVRPGDQLLLSAQLDAARGGLVECSVSARVSGRVVADGRLIIAA